MRQDNPRVLVWDWSIRIFHGLFAAAVAWAFACALLGDEHGDVFAWHMLGGIAAAFLLLVRIALGFVAARPARWAAMGRALRRLPAHLRGVPAEAARDRAGHNPLAWAVYAAMFVLLALTVLTGLYADREWAEEVHGVFAYTLLATIGLHLLGLAWHTVRRGEPIALAMATGRRRGRADEAIPGARPVLGGAVLVVCAVFLGQLVAGYDAAARTVRLPWLGTSVDLAAGEGAGESHRDRHAREDGRGHGHDEDDDD